MSKVGIPLATRALRDGGGKYTCDSLSLFKFRPIPPQHLDSTSVSHSPSQQTDTNAHLTELSLAVLCKSLVVTRFTAQLAPSVASRVVLYNVSYLSSIIRVRDSLLPG